MINPDTQSKYGAAAETEDDERARDQRTETIPEMEREEQPTDHPRSTAEVAKNLESGQRGEKTGNGIATLFPEKESDHYRTRWTNIQSGFVDEPRRSVEQADALVAEVTKRLADGFAQERSKLEGQWGRGDDVSTEDLRVALQRYRAFFDRLLKV